MNCPTCGDAMDDIQEPESACGRWWCQQCGTLTVGHGSYTGGGAPQLVVRCRQFETEIAGLSDTDPFDDWQSMGIAECINTPENRPTETT